jgi:hypothetical protein
MSVVDILQQNVPFVAAASAAIIGGAFLLRSRSSPSARMPLPFGSLLGLAPGGVPAYSCKGVSFRSHYNGDIYYGARFARRWLVHTQGVTFGR